jgi:hypothetical protein
MTAPALQNEIDRVELQRSTGGAGVQRDRPGEVDEGLVGRPPGLGEEQIGNHPLATVGGVETDTLDDPILRARVGGFDAVVERAGIVVIRPPVDREHGIRGRVLPGEVPNQAFNGAAGARDRGIAGTIRRQAKAVAG